MQSPTKIVVALEAAESLVAVYAEACALARTFGAELVLAHAIPESPPLTPGFDVVADQIRETFSDLRLKAQREGLSVSDTDYVRFGDVEKVLAEVIEESGANWLVMGAANKSTIDFLLLGSTAEKVLRTSAVPVWLVRPGRPHRDVKRILCAYDGSEPSREAIATAAFLARNFVGHLTVLTVGKSAEASQIQRQLVDEFDLHGVEVELTTRSGDAAEEVLDALADDPADLLVLGCAGRRGLKRLFHKNTAERLVRKAPCSLLSLRAPGEN